MKLFSIIAETMQLAAKLEQAPSRSNVDNAEVSVHRLYGSERAGRTDDRSPAIDVEDSLPNPA